MQLSLTDNLAAQPLSRSGAFHISDISTDLKAQNSLVLLSKVHMPRVLFYS